MTLATDIENRLTVVEETLTVTGAKERKWEEDEEDEGGLVIGIWTVTKITMIVTLAKDERIRRGTVTVTKYLTITK